MLTPFDLEEDLEKLRKLKCEFEQRGSFDREAYNCIQFALYERVLIEIARGSIDAKTLAKKALQLD